MTGNKHLLECMICQNDMNPSNISNQEQDEEIVALYSIYGDEFKFDNAAKDITLIIHSSDRYRVILKIKITNSYPNAGKCEYAVFTEPKLSIQNSLLLWNKNGITDFIALLKRKELELQTPNQVYLFELLEFARSSIKQFWQEEEYEKKKLEGDNLDETNKEKLETDYKLIEVPSVIFFSGEAVTHRKSTFQAHVACIKSQQNIEDFLSILKNDKRIAQATHNIMAYRFKKSESLIYEDFDDDGEHGAGQKLLFMIRSMQTMNICIVVTRWFGGILLGGDRFRYINECAKMLILSQKDIFLCKNT